MELVRGIGEEEATSSSSFGQGNPFKLLQKSGWRVGSGLGADEQGRLNPLETHAKFDKRGIGADKPIRKRDAAMGQGEKETNSLKQKVKPMSKKARKAKMEAERLQEQAFQRDFFREFWPENV